MPVTPEGQDPLAGQLLGVRYRLESVIAAGGMGEVYRGRDELLDRPVAVKLIKGSRLTDESSLSAFRDEARLAASLSHPGVAQVFDYGEQSGPGAGDGPPRPYLVMELVSGQQLSALIAMAGALPAGVVLDITGQAAQALQAAHDLGITHRDVKPANLLITDDGRVKITDFGIAAAGPGAQAVGAAGNEPVLGTASYMSPEQAEGAPVAPSSDVYSLGIVAYQCVAGRLPFTAETPMALAVAQVREEPPPLPAAIPAPVRDLIMRMIAKDPLQRPAAARDVADAANEMLTELRAGGPQLADVAAWVTAGTGEPLTEADSRGTTMVQPAVRGGRLSSRRSRSLVAAALICLAGGTAAAITAAILMLPGSSKTATTHIQSGPIAVTPAPTARPVTHHSTSSSAPSPSAATVTPSRTAQPVRASPEPSQPPVTQAAPPSPPPSFSAPPSPTPSAPTPAPTH